MISLAAPGENFFHLWSSDSLAPLTSLQAHRANVIAPAEPVDAVWISVVIATFRKFTSTSGCGSFSQVPVLDLCACAEASATRFTNLVLHAVRGVAPMVPD